MQKTEAMGKDKDNADSHNRDEAYTLSAPDQHIAYYDAWADTYDDDFLIAEGYAAPHHVAAYLCQRITDNVITADDLLVADIGCGTGAVGNSLKTLGGSLATLPRLHGFDISQGMLDVAAKTGHYHALHQADFTQSQPQFAKQYGVIVSSGTFTLGHLGPEDLWRALCLGRSGALGLISINAAHFEEKGFLGAFQNWARHGMISQPKFHEIGLYFDANAATTDNLDGLLAEFNIITS